MNKPTNSITLGERIKFWKDHGSFNMELYLAFTKYRTNLEGSCDVVKKRNLKIVS